MFTGLISDIGTVQQISGDMIEIGCRYETQSIAVGASIACDGCCLTVTDRHAAGEGGSVFTVMVSNETRQHTTLGNWAVGRKVNLERSLRLGDELGGHIVTGHVDGVGGIVSRDSDGDSARFVIEVPGDYKGFIAAKGSVALNGTSFTVNEVEENRFGVNIIPHTLAVTTWGGLGAGDRINFEVDLLARYVARMRETGL